MPRPAAHTKTELLLKLSNVFRLHGLDGTSMQTLSQVTGLSKASLYHHFPGGKDEMAEKVLVEEGRRLQALVLSPLEGTEPIHALTESLKGVAKFYSGSVPQCLMNSIMLGRGQELFRERIAAVVGVWRQRLEAAYGAAGSSDEEASAWALYALQRLQGALILCRVEKSRQALDHCLEELHGDVQFLAED